MDEMEEKLKDICNMKETLVCAMRNQLGNLDALDTKEAGEVIDMIKDLAETEYYSHKSKYYKTVVEAMEQETDELYGYNGNRYANGQYAPKGRGHVGYHPVYNPKETWGEFSDPEFRDRMRMGYSNEQSRMTDERYGRPYNDYQRSKRHYTETKAITDRQEMDKHANEHLMDTISTLREIWKDSDPELRKRMKTDLTTLMNEMTI